MTATARTRRPPRLASDVVRSWISVGVGMTAIVVTVLSAPFLFPEAVLSIGLDTFQRLVYYGTWTLFCATYIVLSFVAFHGLDGKTLRSRVTATDPGTSRFRRFWWALNGGGAIWWALTGAIVTLLSLVELIASGTTLTPVLVVSSVAVVVVTVTLTVTAFAVNYAREDAVRGGLEFPGTPEPRFGDYVYLSIQLTTTFGGSDVTVRRRRMRRIVSMHSLLSCAFNTVIVALLVSVLVGRLACRIRPRPSRPAMGD